MNLDRLYTNIADSRAGEGFRGRPYKDPRGFTSIAFGRNLDGNPLTVDEGRYLMKNDVSRVIAQLRVRITWFDALDDVRQRVLAELAYTMGVVGLLEFKHMLAAIVAEEWVTAHAELLNSQWAKQVQLARRDRLASMLLTGTELL